MKPASFSVTDLSNCDREPIHSPGSIQPHGFLFVLERGTWLIRGASANVRDFFAREVSALIGESINVVVEQDLTADLERVCDNPDVTLRPLFLRTILLSADGNPQNFTLVAHQSNELVILEGEKAAESAALQIEQELQTFLGQLSSTDSSQELQRLAVAEIRRLTGFDRCLLYQFDADWNGTVIAEDRNSVLPKYLNQRFPAADIPKQARELYRRNRLRLIPNNTYRPSPVILRAGEIQAESLDMSLSVLRSVSPIHLEYMRNMGTGSSMSMAVLRDGELWGLLACHSLAPRWIPFATRSVCDLLAQFFGLQLATREQSRALVRRIELTVNLTRLIGDLAHASDVTEIGHADELLGLAGASGVALISDGKVVLHGETPTTEQVQTLAKWISGKKKPLLSWQNLAGDFLPGSEFADKASGVLAISIQEEPFAGVLWFRPELINVIEWGGEPRKAIEVHGEGRSLHPRKSFEIWRETLRQHSAPWEAAAVLIASDFREAILDTLFRQPSKKNAHLKKSSPA
jgi:light-regulated signal transduction histidine kinase (bacteriophytochrome)